MEPLFELEITTASPGSRALASHLLRQLKDAILDGRLRAGSRLPSTRDAKRVFGVARNTAQEVYHQLAQEGLVEARQGAGTYVRRPRSRAPAVVDAAPRISTVPLNPIWARADIQSWMGFWQEGSAPAPTDPLVADLRPALIDQRLFPHATFRQVMARQLRRLETHQAPSRSPQRNQGNRRLRSAIAEHVGLTRAIACRPDDVLVTSGAQQAFDLIARTLVVPGQTIVAVEDPGYPPMRVPFASAGAKIVPVPVDDEGIVVDAIPADARIVCVSPSHQFPLGMPLSPRRRAALLDFAAARGAIIVEDDYDGEFRHDGSPLEALRSLSASDVFYVGSFSKSMFPAIRLGFVVAPDWALPSLVTAKNSTDWHSSIPMQAAVASFIHDGHLTRHIQRVRKTYRVRRDALLSLLDRHADDLLAVIPSVYGMHVALVTRRPVDCEAVAEALAGRGIIIHSLARYHLGPATRSGFVIGYAAVDVPQLERAIRALSDELRRCAYQAARSERGGSVV